MDVFVRPPHEAIHYEMESAGLVIGPDDPTSTWVDALKDHSLVQSLSDEDRRSLVVGS